MKKIVTLLFLFTLFSCSSGGAESDTPVEYKKGVLDLPITNIDYLTSSGITGQLNNGEFEYLEGDTINLSYQGLFIGTAITKSELTLLEFFNLKSITQTEILDAIDKTEHIEKIKSRKELDLLYYSLFLSKLYHLDNNSNLNDGIELPQTISLNANSFYQFLRQPMAYILATNDISSPTIDIMTVYNKFIESNLIQLELNKQLNLHKDFITTIAAYTEQNDYQYDSNDRIVKSTNTNFNTNIVTTIAYEYAGANLTKVTTFRGNITSSVKEYAYKDGYLEQIKTAYTNGLEESLTYDIYSNLIKTEYSNGYLSITEIVNGLPSKTLYYSNGILQSSIARQYERGFITRLNLLSAEGTPIITNHYQYDNNGQKTYSEVNYFSPDSKISISTEYSLGLPIKRIELFDYATKESIFTYNTQQQLTQVKVDYADSSSEHDFLWQDSFIIKVGGLAKNPPQSFSIEYNQQNLPEQIIYLSPKDGDEDIISIYSGSFNSSTRLIELPSLNIEQQDYCGGVGIQC